MDTTLIGPPVEYREVAPLSSRKTYPLLNHFVINTVDFVNKFSTICEQKLSQLERQMERLEITMATLEAKLGSIPGLETVTAGDYVPGSVAPAAPSIPAESAGVLPPPPPPPPGASGGSTSGALSPSSDFDDTMSMVSAMPPAPPPNAGNEMTVRKDPKFAPYIRMLNMGVPLQAVKIKMNTDGVNPAAVEPDNLDKPSSLFKKGGAAPASVRGGDSDDDDDDDDMSSDGDNDNGAQSRASVRSPSPPPPPPPPMGRASAAPSAPVSDDDDDDDDDFE